MNYKEFNVAIPIKANNVLIVDGIVQLDTANIVNARLMDGTEPFDFTGYTEVFIEILKPDGTHIQACVTDDPEINDANNPYTIQVVDPKEGRVSFTLQGQATILTGSHFAQITIMAGGRPLSTARLNYYVGGTLRDPDIDLTSHDEYTTLLTLINRNSSIAEAERVRVDSETQRKLREIEREERMLEMEADVKDLVDTADERIEATERNAELAKQYAELAQNPSKEIMQALIEELNLVEKLYVDNLVATSVRNFDAGSFTDDADSKRLLKARTGLAAEMPALAEGEFGFATDTKRLYVGDTPINGVYYAGSEAPEETHLLWIDTSAGGVVKYHDGIAWQPTATATFS